MTATDPAEDPLRRFAAVLMRLPDLDSGAAAEAFLLAKRDISIARLAQPAGPVQPLDWGGVDMNPASLATAADLAVRFSQRPLVVCHQRAVGHGGFHTGALGIGIPRLKWVYDCGSWRSAGKEVLAGSIVDYTSRLSQFSLSERGTDASSELPTVDLLFISHFDTDHISGIAALLALARVDTVIIPYLEPEEQFAVIAGAVAEDQWSSDLPMAVLNPGVWFGDRGVRRVIRVRPGAPGDGEGPLFGAPLLPASEIGGAGDGETAVLLDEKRHPIANVAAPPRQSATLNVKPGVSIVVQLASGTQADWVFVPHVHPASCESRGRVRAAIEKILELKVTDRRFPRKFLIYVTGPRRRRRLKEIYLEYGLGDANAVSLSLYSGPIQNDGYSRILVSPTIDRGLPGFGWLLTGDAELGNRHRRDAWILSYGALGPAIGNLMIPHHGAAANFHRKIVELAGHTARLFVTANAADPLRPHENVRGEIGRPIMIVTQNEIDALRQVSGPAPLPRFSDIAFDLVADWA